ncbi:MAG: hypothetical protein ACK47M_07680 [Caldilinea sp.]
MAFKVLSFGRLFGNSSIVDPQTAPYIFQEIHLPTQVTQAALSLDVRVVLQGDVITPDDAIDGIIAFYRITQNNPMQIHPTPLYAAWLLNNDTALTQ